MRAARDAAVSAEEEQARLLPVLEGILEGAAGRSGLSGHVQGGDGARGARGGRGDCQRRERIHLGPGDGERVRGVWRGRGADAHARAARRVARRSRSSSRDALLATGARWAGGEPGSGASGGNCARIALCSIRATDSASDSTRTTRCWRGRRSCWRWGGRCWRGLAANRFWATRWRRCLAGTMRHWMTRENASLAAMTAAILHGASIVRVHAVRAGGGGGADCGCDSCSA